MDKERIQQVDSQNMWQKLVDYPRQWDEAMELTRDLELEVDRDRISNICLVGMGGSATGPEMLRAYCYDRCPYPVQVIRHYELPAWVDERTLCIACSYSGNTEETLSALEQSRELGAQAVAITSGGEMRLQAAREGFDYIKIPGGIPTRSALGYMFVPLYRIFQYLGLAESGDDILKQCRDFLDEQNGLFSNPADNEALNLAEELNDTLPIFYADAVNLEPVAHHWRSQFEENAKTLSYGNTMPEMTHNEIVGWERIVHLTGRLSVVMLKDENDNPRVKRRMEIVEELIEDQAASLHILKSRGGNRLTRMFSLIQLADWTSFYLAVLSNVDPTPVTKIDLLKSKLAEA